MYDAADIFQPRLSLVKANRIVGSLANMSMVNKAGQPYATCTKLGWALQGPVDEYIGGKACVTTNHIQLEQLN